MLHAPLVTSTAKLDIGSLLTSSPSPPPRHNPTPTTTQPPPFPRSISVPTLISQYPSIASPSTSSASHYSTSTAPLQGYGQAQTAPWGARPPPTGANSKRGPPTNPHPLSSPAKKQSKWSAPENTLLVSLRGANMKWSDISKQIPGRTATSCRLRYQNYVERDNAWTEEKKDKLARLYERYVFTPAKATLHPSFFLLLLSFPPSSTTTPTTPLEPKLTLSP